MKCLDVLKEDIQEVGVREDEVFGCVGRRHAGREVREDEVFGCVGRRHSGGGSEGR